jgi:GntR family transcriptional regulator/MocR family aminotransferase
MPKRPAGSLVDVEISFSGNTPLHRQLYVALKNAILRGRLRPGARLPSTRAIADDLGVSRTTVLNAFDQLSAEGYLEGAVGSGTRVTPSIPGDLKKLAAKARARTSSGSPMIAGRARLKSGADLSFLRTAARPLRPGHPDLRLFPLDLWARLSAKHWRRTTRDPEHADSLGYRPLRQAVCDYIAKLRGVRCEPDQVLILSGAQQAIYLCAHILLDAGDVVWFEEPGYPRARAALLSAGLRVVPVPVDSEGLIVSAGRRKAPSPKLVFVTPSFQCPLGSMMSLSRRFELLALSRESRAWILEDDYFCEYGHGGNPAASLQSLDRSDRVIYVGSFSKSIVPSLRLGYVVLPPALVDVFTQVRQTMSRQPPGVDQSVLAEFIREGHLERHVRATLRVYRERQEVLMAALQADARGLIDVSSRGTGLYLVGWLRPGVNDRTAAKAAAADGVDVIPLSAFSIEPSQRPGLVMGYSGYDTNRIRVAVKRLALTLSRFAR